MKHITETEWNEYLAQTAGPERTAEIEAHSAQCPLCRARMQECQKVPRLLDRWQVNTAGHDISAKISHTLRSSAISPRWTNRRQPQVWRYAAQLAATVLIAVSLGWLVGRNSADRLLARRQETPLAAEQPGYLAALDLQFASDLTWSVLDTDNTRPEDDQ